jgi:proline dehydrogenase
MSMITSAIREFGNFFFLRMMNRWVAGANAGDALGYCRKLNEGCIINLLGEHYKSSNQASEAAGEYKKLIDAVSASRTNASLTIKPSQFGFNAEDIPDPKKLCREKMLDVVQFASGKTIFVWLDMEDSRFTDFTLDFYSEFAPNSGLGICLQANLLRTKKDIDRLIALSKSFKVRLRLVKGIYVEDPKISIRDPKTLHKNFLALIKYAFEKSPPSFGIAVGSHHEEAIELAITLQKKHRKEFFEIQVLKGVLPDYYAELRKRGVKVVEYVPYGRDAFAYSVRRARKNPGFARSILFGVFFDAYKKLYR